MPFSPNERKRSSAKSLGGLSIGNGCKSGKIAVILTNVVLARASGLWRGEAIKAPTKLAMSGLFGVRQTTTNNGL